MRQLVGSDPAFPIREGTRVRKVRPDAERRPSPRQHDHPHAVVAIEARERVVQLARHLGGPGIAALGAIEADDAGAALLDELEGDRPVFRHEEWTPIWEGSA